MAHGARADRPALDRRRGMRLSYLNGALWAIGNGLTTGPVISYFVQDLGARGRELSLILALPALVGLGRLAAPSLIRWRGTAKRTCLETFWASYLVLATLPFLTVAAAGGPKREGSLAAFIALLSLHQLLEFTGAVALWTWLAEIVPARVRGRFFARRNIWQLAVLIPALYASTTFIDRWRAASAETVIVAYSIVTAVGVAFLLASIVPLHLMPATTPATQRATTAAGQGAWLAVFEHRPLRMLLAFGCWLSFFNGLTQVAQNVYPKEVLKISLATMAGLQMAMRLGQIGISAWTGPFADRYGCRPALILAQLLVAAGPLLYFFAQPGETAAYLIGAAYLLWTAYAVLNVCQPTLLLKLAPEGHASRAIALVFAATSVAYAAGTVLGGAWFDWLRAHLAGGYPLAGRRLDHFDVQFLCGWVTRTAAVVWLVALAEPGAWRWREIAFGRSTQPGDQPA